VQQRREDFRRLTLATRAELQALYSSDASDEAKRAGKARILADMRARHQAWKAAQDGPWAGFAGYDAWFAQANNALLGVQAAYNDQVPDFEALFERLGGDFDRFYAEVKTLAALPPEQRRATLAARP
jgi:predicted aminopeptidase